MGDFIESWRGVSVSESGDELVGVTLNNSYTVERLLGEGGMGRVYLARHTRIAQKRVAVKVLLQEFAGNIQVLARFQREAEAAAAIAHPNVLTLLDVDVTPGGMPYLVCEYLEGVDLADHLREVKRLDVLDAISVTRQLCRGLGAAHAHGVIHRDLKPPNVFLVGDFSKGAPARLYAKVLDFGLSRFHTQGEQSSAATERSASGCSAATERSGYGTERLRSSGHGTERLRSSGHGTERLRSRATHNKKRPARVERGRALATERAFALRFVGGSRCAAAQVAWLWGSWHSRSGGGGRLAGYPDASGRQEHQDLAAGLPSDGVESGGRQPNDAERHGVGCARQVSGAPPAA